MPLSKDAALVRKCCWQVTIDGKNEFHSFEVQVETPEEARAAVRRYKDAGYKQIKIRDNVKLETLKVRHTLHRELELYVKAGLTPLEAIQAATITPARVMKLENEVGTIGSGKRADI